MSQDPRPDPHSVRTPRFRVHPQVFFISAGLILSFIIVSVLFTETLDFTVTTLQNTIERVFGWWYILLVATLLPFVLWLMVSRYGSIRLGDDDEKPEFGYFAWFSMLFSAGMGIGLLFYSVAEPMFHFASPPQASAAPESLDAAVMAMDFTYFHWGLHAWAIYAFVGLVLAYFSFRHKLPLTIRSALYPLLGERIHGWSGNTVDVIAVVSTLFGVATSLGIGVMQVNAGLNRVFGADESLQVQLLLIAGITAIATISVVSGVGAGIRRLSELNLIMAGILMLFVIALGPTLYILRSFVQSIGHYIQYLPQMSLWSSAWVLERDDARFWQGSWTIFYWAWWMAWSPFVGMFIARISRGRTIREFIMGVLFVPTALTFLWLAIFGNTALHSELFGPGGIKDVVVGTEEIAGSPPQALFALLEQFPLSIVTSFFATIVVVNFFVTSSDSGSLVIDIITAGGDPDPPVLQRVFWAVLEGAVAAILLTAGYMIVAEVGEGDASTALNALQTGAITTALPLSIVLVVVVFGLVRALRRDYKTGRITNPPRDE